MPLNISIISVSLSSVVNQDYATAIEIMETLLKKHEGKKDLILCGIGRIYLQVGLGFARVKTWRNVPYSQFALPVLHIVDIDQ